MILAKPWGYEEVLLDNGRFVIKRIVVQAGHRLSLQYHAKKDEAWIIRSGEGSYVWKDIVFEYHADDIVSIPTSTIHRISPVVTTEIIEVSTPELEDIVRLEDDYGRA